MKRTGMRLVRGILAALLWTGGAALVQATDFMSVEEIHEGMHGTAKTVVQGDRIDTFDVDVLGVMKQRGPSGDLILVRVSGPVIDKTGGIAQGMSGSPVYIDGKLVGAIAYGWGFADGKIGMVTPIGDMLKLWNVEDSRARRIIPPTEKGLIPLTTPVMASGFSPESLQYLTEKLAPLHLAPYATGAAGSYDAVPHEPEAGGAVAATLMTGDLKLGAIGTVTYADGDRIVAFGHPFLKRGTIDYFMHNSYIFTVVPSVNSAFKLGSIGREIGKINQDRGAGIAGRMHWAPAAVPMSIHVTDTDTGETRRADVRMVNDPQLTPVLAATGAFDLAQKTLDRGGRGTVKLTYMLTPKEAKLKPITRTNMYYSRRSVSERSVDELYNILNVLAKNPFVDYELRGIKMTMEITQERRVAEILDASATPAVVSPGDHIFIRVRLRPHREPEIYRQLVFQVPADQPFGKMTLEVRGGGVTPLPYLIQKQQLNLTDEILERLRSYKNFEDLRHRLENEDLNQQIVVEILEDGVSAVPDERDHGNGGAVLYGHEPERLPDNLRPGTNAASKRENDDTERSKVRLDTEYIIEGDGQFTFDVVDAKEKERRLREMKQTNPELQADMHHDDKPTESAAEATPDDSGKPDTTGGKKSAASVRGI